MQFLLLICFPLRCFLYGLGKGIDFCIYSCTCDNIHSWGNQAMASKLLLQRRLFRFLQLSPSSFCSSSSSSIGSPCHSVKAAETLSLSTSSRSFCSQKSNLVDESHGPTPIDYRYDPSFYVFRSYVLIWFMKTPEICAFSYCFFKRKKIKPSSFSHLFFFLRKYLKNISEIQMSVAIGNASQVVNDQHWLIIEIVAVFFYSFKWLEMILLLINVGAVLY